MHSYLETWVSRYIEVIMQDEHMQFALSLFVQVKKAISNHPVFKAA